MGTEQDLVQTRRRRGSMLKLIRQGHEKQLDRMDDSDMGRMMLFLGHHMSPRQVMTMLQDLEMLGYIAFDQRYSETLERFVAERIMLTAVGASLALRRQDNDEVTFD